MMEARDKAKEIAMSFYRYATYADQDNSLSDDFDQWASTPEAKSLIAQLSGVGGMKFGEWQICPRCFGNKQIQNPYMNVASSKLFIDCDMCNGEGKLVKPVIESPIPSGEQDGGWISVEDRLPELDQSFKLLKVSVPVLVISDDVVNAVPRTDHWNYNKDLWYSEACGSHWMPLSVLPKFPKTITP